MILYMNAASERLLEQTLARRPHAVLLTGPYGVGLRTIALHFTTNTSAEVLQVLPERDERVDIERGTITVQSIRRLYDATRSIAPKGRIIVIDYAERMAIPAQNAFLKLLEEPTEGTQFILLSHEPERLLPTIMSRVQRVEMRPISSAQSEQLLNDQGIKDATVRTQLLFIAQGLPAELSRLITDSAYFESRAQCMKDARLLVTGSPYQRLLIAKNYKDSRSDALTLVENVLKLLKMTLKTHPDAATLRALAHFEVLHTRLSEQGNVRLQLSAAVMV